MYKIFNSGSKTYSEACEWGKRNEKTAIEIYEKRHNEQFIVQECGLVVNPIWSWLGASPDGLFSINGNIRALEIKCPFAKRYLTVAEACRDKSFYLQSSNGKIHLKKTHHYQCQGIMGITEISEIDFVVYTTRDIFIETICFDSNIWNNNILPCLTRFYFDFMKDKIFTEN